MTKNKKKPIGVFSILGAGTGLLAAPMGKNLALGLIFGFALGVIIDSIVYLYKKEELQIFRKVVSDKFPKIKK